MKNNHTKYNLQSVFIVFDKLQTIEKILMENWRKSVVEVLRECNGESNLEEIYDKIEHLIPDLNIDWKAGKRRTLETNNYD